MDKLLIDYRTGPDVMMAAAEGEASRLPYLMQDARQWQPDSNGDTSVHVAVRFGQYDFLEQLLRDWTVNLDKPNNKGITPLLLAA